MNLKINAGTLVGKHFLEVTDTGVVFMESSAFGSTKKFSFDQIDAVLRSDTLLSVQVGRDLYRIPISPQNALHRSAMARLVSEARRSVRKRP